MVSDLLLIAFVGAVSPSTKVGEFVNQTRGGAAIILVQAGPRWGVKDPSTLSALESELMDILTGPAENNSRSVLSQENKMAIEADPELHEAYRSAPAATLALISRIRDAGGLKQ
jgi:hypothetical protein